MDGRLSAAEGAVSTVGAAEAEALLEPLARLLVDAVSTGASVGFLAPLHLEDALAWWRGVLPDVASGRLTLLVAREAGAVVGTVQVRSSPYPNARHRAELAKLLVDSGARRRGLGRRLLLAAEDAARDQGVSLLVLDTETGSRAQSLYASAGWVVVGSIPDFALLPDGRLAPTTVMYRAL